MGDGVVLGEGCTIGPNAVIFEQVLIGEDVRGCSIVSSASTRMLATRRS